jgi:hypothetical protein
MKIFPDYLSLFSRFLSSFGGLPFPGIMALAPEILPAQESVYNTSSNNKMKIDMDFETGYAFCTDGAIY